MVRPNDEVVLDFLNTIVRVTSPGASDKYVYMLLSKFCEKNKEFFPFVGYIRIDMGGITVDSKLNSIQPKSVGKFLKAIITILFSDLFVLMIKKKINPNLAEELEYFGVNLA